MKVNSSQADTTDSVNVERIALEVEPGVVVPLVLLRSTPKDADGPVVVAFARDGKDKLLAARCAEFAQLLAGGAVVCLADLRGTGETRAGGYEGPSSTETALSCRDQVLGQTPIGSRLRDLRAVLTYLRTRKDLGDRYAIWGDSLADANPADRSPVYPLRVNNPNVYAEPTAGLLALLCGLFDDDVTAIYARGTIPSFRTLLQSQFLYVPHDAVLPGVLEIGDVADLAAAVAPRPLRLDRLVNGLNREVAAGKSMELLAPAAAAYRGRKSWNSW